MISIWWVHMVEIACCKFQWSLITALLCIIKLYKCLNCRETPIILPCNSRVHDFAPTTIFFKRLLFRKWLRRLRGRCVRAKQAHLNAGSTVCDIGFRSKKKKTKKKKRTISIQSWQFRSWMISLNEMLQSLQKTYIKEATFKVGVGNLEGVHATNTCFLKFSLCV